MSSIPSNPFQEFSEAWASIYPLLHWTLEHPIGSLLVVFGGLYLFWGLLRGLIYLTENLWIRLLRSPLLLVQYVWRMIEQKRFNLGTAEKADNIASLNSAYDRLQSLINQIEDGHRRQEQLLHKAKLELSKLKTSD